MFSYEVSSRLAHGGDGLINEICKKGVAASLRREGRSEVRNTYVVPFEPPNPNALSMCSSPHPAKVSHLMVNVAGEAAKVMTASCLLCPGSSRKSLTCNGEVNRILKRYGCARWAFQ